MKRDDEAEREQHRRRSRGGSSPSNSVPSQEKILIPVGTAISSVVIIIGTRSHANMPETNMWCAQTEKLSTTIPSSARAISR